jgi:acyl-lipid omega-6 desaturase (Delta-12 desaturase)
MVPFVALWAPDAAEPPPFLLALAGFLVRLFMIQHDCGHGSFFRRRRANDWLARTSGHLGPARHGRRRRADRARVPEHAGVALRSLIGVRRHPIVVLGVGPFLSVRAQAPPVASSAGVWLFYVQHQFEHTYWAWGADWNLHTGALHGSSHYDLPPVLRWFTANIGIHHVHHLCSRIPCYRLGEALREHPELRRSGRLTLRENFRCLRFALWDEDKRRLVGVP